MSPRKFGERKEGERSDRLTVSERELIYNLREEAWNVKDCFTEYSLKTLGFSAAALGLIARFSFDQPLTALASIPVIILLITVARIGTHKYATSNRIHGYILHLERIAHLSSVGSCSNVLRTIGWEEAMKAWRVVQAATFQNLYEYGYCWRPKWLNRKPFNKLPWFKRRNTPKQINGLTYKWFEPASLCTDLSQLPKYRGLTFAEWHPGDYLGNMINVLFAMTAIAVLPLILGLIRSLHQTGSFIALLVAFILTCLYAGYQIGIISARKRLLEGGLLSIHSCAVMWHAVTKAHHRAWLALKSDPNENIPSISMYRGFTTCLTWLAANLNGRIVVNDQGDLSNSEPQRIQHIHAWIDQEDSDFVAYMQKEIASQLTQIYPSAPPSFVPPYSLT